MKQVLEHITSRHSLRIKAVLPLSGGDINEVFRIQSSDHEYVLKINQAVRYPGMFEAEAKGLELLRQSNSFKIPKVIGHDTVATKCYLLMEYIPSGNASANIWEAFAEALSQLHSQTHQHFGLDHANYIGRLPQANHWQTTAADFYITQRLEPQFKQASEKGYTFGNLNAFYKVLSEEIPTHRPSLIHGDLWNGNYLIAADKNPVLIDPAVAFGSREMDLAMMQLFGGFPKSVFSAYANCAPLEDAWESRIQLWQLYYVLVHLNLFGSGYLHQVQSILARYS
ncbi:fructosamine kinase family protein [Altibacter sp.]|uniref:fructosamine kinase family protein n=1 Tax=Altibacter sp. TaxID=2024823 RepID=UPI000C970266|nr:fructosamine kinase family protein [Altibacter sp.]MAP53335.1 fructosamine kinase [Altibacter sp.]